LRARPFPDAWGSFFKILDRKSQESHIQGLDISHASSADWRIEEMSKHRRVSALLRR
jgi:hypothetical protein